MKKISVIIPCYNEGKRIIPVISELIKSDQLSELIVVDDGSEKDTIDVLYTLPKQVKIIRHLKNKGKAEAMKTGLMSADGVVVAFIDADLRGFKAKHLKKLCKPVIDGVCDMCLGVREFEVIYARIINFGVAYGGERAFNRRKLIENIDMFKSGGYMIEASMNRYYLRNGRVAKVFFDGVGQTAKLSKRGVAGLLGSFKMLYQILKYIGFKEFIYQISAISKLKYYNDI